MHGNARRSERATSVHLLRRPVTRDAPSHARKARVRRAPNGRPSCSLGLRRGARTARAALRASNAISESKLKEIPQVKSAFQKLLFTSRGSLPVVLAAGLAAACGSTETPPAQGGSCSPGDTRECVGVGACRGGQRCGDDGRWGDCACTGTMTITDGHGEGGDGAVHWTSDPCPAVHNYANYSSTCGDTPPAHQAVICTSDTVDKWFSSNPGFARIRTPDKSGPGCPCGPNRYSMVILEEPIDTSSVALRVNPPWGLWIGPISDFIDGGVANPFCNTPSLT